MMRQALPGRKARRGFGFKHYESGGDVIPFPAARAADQIAIELDSIMSAVEDVRDSMLLSAWPPFLDQLDTDPEGAWAAIYDYAMRLMHTHPPRKLRLFDAQDHEDLKMDIIVHFCKDRFHKLRLYRNKGLPFAWWALYVANNFLQDKYEKDHHWQNDRLPDQDAEGQSISEQQQDPGPSPADIANASEIVRRALAQIGKECQLLLIGALVEGRKPRELIALMGLPKEENKRISDKIRDCRKALMRKLIDAGIDPGHFARAKQA